MRAKRAGFMVTREGSDAARVLGICMKLRRNLMKTKDLGSIRVFLKKSFKSESELQTEHTVPAQLLSNFSLFG